MNKKELEELCRTRFGIIEERGLAIESLNRNVETLQGYQKLHKKAKEDLANLERNYKKLSGYKDELRLKIDELEQRRVLEVQALKDKIVELVMGGIK